MAASLYLVAAEELFEKTEALELAALAIPSQFRVMMYKQDKPRASRAGLDTVLLTLTARKLPAMTAVEFGAQ